MLNFYALSSSDFVKLSKDVLQKAIGKELYIMDSPNDKGIDITDNRVAPVIVAQAKHCISSPPGKLIHSLKEERAKIEKIKPGQYYLFVSKDLTADRIEDIIDMFRPIVKNFGHENIFTLQILDDILQSPEYKDVLSRYPALWDFSVNVLRDLLNKSVLLDSRELVFDMEEKYREFVPTNIYRECMDVLDTERIILIQGNPGSGKTFTSKMIVYDYVQRGYNAYYTTDNNVRDIKSVIGIDDSKEIILLDDFLGQYLNKMDDTIIRELETLLSFIKRNENKCIILNSRITILQEGFRKYDTQIRKMLNDVHKINMDHLTKYEKARILKNYLEKYFGGEQGFIEYIAADSRYMNIITHRNFNPRIIELTFLLRAQNLEPDTFYKKFMDTLDNPKDIWKDEFESRIKEEDRVLLTTLYSLTNTEIDYEILEKCFIARINAIPGVDKSVNQFGIAVDRLKNSMVRVTISDKRYISVLNPSVNDFLRGYVNSSNMTKDAIVKSAVYFDQIYKILNPAYHICGSKNSQLTNILNSMVSDYSVLELEYLDNRRLGNILIWYCILNEKKLDNSYKTAIVKILKTGLIPKYEPFRIENNLDCILPLFQEPLYSFYDIERLLLDNDFVAGIIECVKGNIKELKQVLSKIWGVISNTDLKNNGNLATFNQLASEEFMLEAYSAVTNLDDFMFNNYDWSEYNSMVSSIDHSWHTDDIKSFCEDELYYFLEEDIRKQYSNYAYDWIYERLYDLEFIDDDRVGKFKIDEDILYIDQDIEKHVKNSIDIALCDNLPEAVYDEYTGQKRESAFGMSLNRYYNKDFIESTKMKEKIDKLFLDCI